MDAPKESAKQEAIICPQCGRRYQWSQRAAGRKVRCPCGGFVEFPIQSPAKEETFELADQPAPKPMRPSVIVRRPPAPANPDRFVEKLRDFQLPLWLLVGGVVVQLGRAFFVAHQGVVAALGEIILDMAVSTGFMLFCVLIAAKIRGISLGRFPIAVFKLAAISVAPDAVAMLIAPAARFIPMLGGFAAPLVGFALRFAFLSMLFELEESDTWYVVAIMFLVGFGVYFTMYWLHPGWGM